MPAITALNTSPYPSKRRRNIPAAPSRPVVKRTSVSGSGTDGVSAVIWICELPRSLTELSCSVPPVEKPRADRFGLELKTTITEK